MEERTEKQVLIVLPGLTADRGKREFMLRFFSQDDSHAVYVANIPRRRGLSACALWLDGYLTAVVRPEHYHAVNVLAFISGGIVLRRMTVSRPIVNLSRVVYVRSPIQELTLHLLRERYGAPLLWILRGQLMLDVAAVDMEGLGYPSPTYGHGLIIETGISGMARSLGVGAEDVPTESWAPNGLLPGAEEVIHVPESHDDVYTSESLLAAAQHFFTHGSFHQSGGNLVKG